MGMWELAKLMGSLLLVFGLLAALLWALRQLQSRLQGAAKGADRHLKLLETLSVGPRQKIALVEVDGQRVLVGISAQHMTALSDPLPARSGSRSWGHA